MGMVGGGRGAFIGNVHRMAANLDGKIELVAGAFSADPEKSRLSGEDFFLDPTRVYGSYQEMAEKEAARPEGDRIDFVSIVVRNNLHFDVAKTFLEAGIHVICDKPITFTLEQAYALREIVKKTGLVFALTHNYTGYPMVKEARRMVRDGELGRMLKIVAEYPQGYAVGDVEGDGQGKISNWRADPKIAGASNCMGDIGTHAHNLVRYITGLEVDEMCSELTAFIPGRELDDDGNNLIRFKGRDDAAQGHHLRLADFQRRRERAQHPCLRHQGLDRVAPGRPERPRSSNTPTPRAGLPPRQRLPRRSRPEANTRTPFAHPEGFIEAFANVYLAAAQAIADRIDGKAPPADGYDFPDVDDGVAGMAFIATAVKSSQSTEKWVKFPEV